MLWCNWVNCLMFIKWCKGLFCDLYVSILYISINLMNDFWYVFDIYC